uniref:SAP domain-containing protein n=1 Tax=Panagrellus redivivus TaxID=6233 RepID=A0A7E4VYX2_PANRE
MAKSGTKSSCDIERTEEKKYYEKLADVPHVEATLINEVNYFEQYFTKGSEELEKPEIEQFLDFCASDQQVTQAESSFFTAKGRQIVKEKQVSLLRERGLSTHSKADLLQQLASATNIIGDKLDFLTVADDFAQLSFQLCSHKSHNKRPPKPRVDNRMKFSSKEILRAELAKERKWIAELEMNVKNKL